MKKVLIGILGLLSVLAVNVKGLEKPEVTDHEKVKVYIFRGSGCSHCYDALTYFNSVDGQYNDYYEVVTYEVWNNSANNLLKEDVASALKESEGGVPLIVIGDKDFVGFGQSMENEVMGTIFSEYQNPAYKDVVAEVLKNNSTAKALSLHDACVEEKIIIEKNPADTIIVLSIFGVLALGLAALVIFSRKK